MRKYVIWIAAVVGIGVTAALGRWQLGRAAQKEYLQAQQQSRALLPMLPQQELTHDPHEVEVQKNRRIILHGIWRAQDTVYLDNRPMHEQPGFYVLTPLLLDGARDAVLVQRGWIPRNAQNRTEMAAFKTASGPVDVVGQVAAWPSVRIALGQENKNTPIRQNVIQEEREASTGLTFRPVAIVETTTPDNSGGNADGLLRDWAAPAIDVSRNYGYAAQWFALSALIAGLTLWFQVFKQRFRRKLWASAPKI
jgi:surfeit locus 1 family protein